MTVSKNVMKTIDEGFKPIIKVLNDKNWITIYCCEGHKEEFEERFNRWDSYIAFKYNYDFPTLPPLFELYTKGKRPKTKHSEMNVAKNGTFFYWFGDTKGTLDEKEEDRKKWLKSLAEWADQLPYKEYTEGMTYYVLVGIGKRGGRKILDCGWDKDHIEKTKEQYDGQYEFEIEMYDETQGCFRQLVKNLDGMQAIDNM